MRIWFEGTVRNRIFMAGAVLCALAMLLFAVVPADALTIVLKSGRRLTVDYVYDTGSRYVCYFDSGLTVGFRKDEVQSVEKINPIGTVLNTASEQPFVFDIWTSGMELEQTFQIAKQQNLPLVLYGREPSGSSYDPRLAEAYAANGRHFSYKTKLLGQKCQVTLHFTPKGALLSDIHVQWDNLARPEEYFQEVKELLAEKYASPQKENVTVKGRSNWWLPNRNVQIMLETVPGGVDLIYLDKAMCLQRDRETVELQKEINQKFSPQDKSRF